jgi:menaquinone-specific isochorismate synthase
LIEILERGCLFSSDSDDVWVGWSPQEIEKKEAWGKHGLQIYAPDFFLEDSKPWWAFPNSQKVSRQSLLNGLRDFVQSHEKSNQRWDWQPANSHLFRETFIQLKEMFQSDFLKKAVPLVFEEARIPFQDQIRAQALIHLLENTQGLPLMLYGMWDLHEGILGASPELLFGFRGKAQPIETAALAGTRLKGSPLPPLLSDPKELEEHQIVIDGIGSSLSHLGRVDVGMTQEVVLPHLSHLYTPLQLRLSPTYQEWSDAGLIQEIVKRLHPTPALGAYPREAGMAWLKAYEKKLPRKRFGAPWGILWESGEGQFVVGIRNLQWEGDRVFLGAGCGVIAASEVEREWNEIQGKIQSVKKVFQL